MSITMVINISQQSGTKILLAALLLGRGEKEEEALCLKSSKRRRRKKKKAQGAVFSLPNQVLLLGELHL